MTGLTGTDSFIQGIEEAISDAQAKARDKFAKPLRAYIEKALKKARKDDPRLGGISFGGGGASLDGEYMTEGGNMGRASKYGFKWRTEYASYQPAAKATRDLLDILNTYQEMDIETMPVLKDIP